MTKITTLPKDLIQAFTPTQVELIKSVIAKGASDDELKLFLYTAKRTGLDPLTKQIHFVKREVNKKLANGAWVKEGQMTVQTGIDGYRAIAERTGKLAGISDATYDSEENDFPNKATVTVYKMVEGQRVEYVSSARWKEYAQVYVKNGVETVGPMWKKMPYLMLAKCAEALALRKAFPNDLSGIYTTEEMAQADNKVPEVVPTVEVVEKASEIAESKEIEHVETDTPVIDVGETPEGDGLAFCPKCEGEISEAEIGYSQKMFKEVACRNCQKSLKK